MSDNTNEIKGQILVIDDDETTESVLEVLLSKEGYQVYLAQNGIEGLKKAEEIKPDLIFMDINMPDMDGYEATSRLKKNPDLASIPVIFLSGLSAESEANKVFQSGGATFIGKPFSNQQLIQVINLAMMSVVKKENSYRE